MAVVTNHQRVELKRAVNGWNERHAKDLLPPLPTSARWDDHAIKVLLRAAYYFGIGQPTIRKWDKYGLTEADIANLIDWFARPSHFYGTHKAAPTVSRTRLAVERAKRKVVTVFRTRTWTNQDGSKVQVAGWIYNVLQAAWNDGVRFHVTDGIRTLEEAWALWNDRANNPNPVSYPGTSHHTGEIHPDGAVDIVPQSAAQAFSDWLDRNPGKARGLTWARWNDIVHFSVPGVHHPGEVSF